MGKQRHISFKNAFPSGTASELERAKYILVVAVILLSSYVRLHTERAVWKREREIHGLLGPSVQFTTLRLLPVKNLLGKPFSVEKKQLCPRYEIILVPFRQHRSRSAPSKLAHVSMINTVLLERKYLKNFFYFTVKLF